MVDETRIVSILATAKLPLTSKLKFNDIIDESNLDWIILNEDRSPMLNVNFMLPEKTASGKPRKVNIAVWAGGHVTINGAVSKEECDNYFRIVCKELRRINVI